MTHDNPRLWNQERCQGPTRLSNRSKNRPPPVPPRPHPTPSTRRRTLPSPFPRTLPPRSLPLRPGIPASPFPVSFRPRWSFFLRRPTEDQQHSTPIRTSPPPHRPSPIFDNSLRLRNFFPPLPPPKVDVAPLSRISAVRSVEQVAPSLLLRPPPRQNEFLPRLSLLLRQFGLDLRLADVILEPGGYDWKCIERARLYLQRVLTIFWVLCCVNCISFDCTLFLRVSPSVLVSYSGIRRHRTCATRFTFSRFCCADGCEYSISMRRACDGTSMHFVTKRGRTARNVLFYEIVSFLPTTPRWTKLAMSLLHQIAAVSSATGTQGESPAASP